MTSRARIRDPRGPFFAGILLIACVMLSLLPSYEGRAAQQPKPSQAQVEPKKPDGVEMPMGQGFIKKDVPLHIASDRMVANQKDRTVVFEGHVVVQQDNLTITGNRMKVYGSAQPAGKAAKADPAAAKDDSAAGASGMMDQVDRIDLDGEVRIVQEDKVATADKAEYYSQEQKIILLGNPQVSQGQDTVQGRVITLFIAEGRSVVEGAESTPVRAILYPKKKEKAQ